MKPRIFFIMDSLSTINPSKDSTLTMIEGAQSLGLEAFYLTPESLFLEEMKVQAFVQKLTINLNEKEWYQLNPKERVIFADTDIVLQRKDPPFNMHYIHTSYLLELMEKQGALVCNNPQSLRDCNEKMFTAWFPELCPKTLVTSQYELIKAFVLKHEDAIIKPLDGMGGSAIFRIKKDDPNLNVILETLTEHQTTAVMVQKYIPEIVKGDKRILMINGEPQPYLLARIPATGETRANLAVGGTGVVQELSENDQKICAIIGPELKKRGLYFVGLDVIGDYVTEINVTSPTGIRQIQNEKGLRIGEQLIETLISIWKNRTNA